MAKLTQQDLIQIGLEKAGGAKWHLLAGGYGFQSGDALRGAYRRAVARVGGGVVSAVARQEEIVSEDEGSGKVLTSNRSTRIRTPEELIAAANIDQTRWSIERSVVNKWEVGVADGLGGVHLEELWQVKVWLKPEPLLATLELLEELKAGIKPLPPVGGRPRSAVRGDKLLVVCPHDLHLDRLSWAPESGGAGWNIEVAGSTALNALDDILRLAGGFSPAAILLVIGNDLLTADASINGGGAGGATTKGTPQDVDGRWQNAFRAATAVCREMIEMCAAVAPVHVVVVPGNHDSTRAFFLGDVLGALYREREDVTVENTPAPRKYHMYGETLLGFCHGHQAKLETLPLLMAQECPIEWSGTSHREWILGHTHAAGLKEIGGVRVRTMPSLASPDAWHAERGYNQIRAMEALIFDEFTGFTGMFSSNG